MSQLQRSIVCNGTMLTAVATVRLNAAEADLERERIEALLKARADMCRRAFNIKAFGGCRETVCEELDALLSSARPISSGARPV